MAERDESIERLLKLSQVEKIAGLKKSAIYQRVIDGTFPRPVKIGCATRWSSREVAEWIAGLKAQRP